MSSTAAQSSINQPFEAIPKTVPPDPEVRRVLREAAAAHVAPLAKERPLSRDEIIEHGRAILASAGRCECLLGYAMVCVANAFWMDAFAAVPLSKRILLLPHCLKLATGCPGGYEGDEFICARCGGCHLNDLKYEAESLGYRVVIAEGSPTVVRLILEESFDAILGVACLDSLEKAFHKIASLGVPSLAEPLLNEGCENTQADQERIRELMRFYRAPESARAATRSYLPLLRKTNRMFEGENLDHLLDGFCAVAPDAADTDPMRAVDQLAVEWLREGGKRLRPFITLAGYVLGKYGSQYLYEHEIPDTILPDSVRRIALAIEVFHKASLVHDDIEDNDPTRYGRETLHRRYSVGEALNAGDFLIGLGYRLAAAQSAEVGAETAIDILNALSSAHLRLCGGQGAEMRWTRARDRAITSLDALAVYSAKTAPAFEIALYAGLRLSHREIDLEAMRSFSRSLGVAYQIQDDLEEWERSPHAEDFSGYDVLGERATLLHAFALEAADEDMRRQLMMPAPAGKSDQEIVAEAYAAYERLGVFAKARELGERFRRRAIAAAENSQDREIVDLLLLLIDTIVKPF